MSLDLAFDRESSQLIVEHDSRTKKYTARLRKGGHGIQFVGVRKKVRRAYRDALDSASEAVGRAPIALDPLDETIDQKYREIANSLTTTGSRELAFKELRELQARRAEDIARNFAVRWGLPDKGAPDALSKATQILRDHERLPLPSPSSESSDRTVEEAPSAEGRPIPDV